MIKRLRNKKELIGKKRLRRKIAFYVHLIFYIICGSTMLISSVYVDLRDAYNFPLWIIIVTMVFWSIALLFQASKVFGKHIIFNKKWEDQKIKEMLQEDEKKTWI